ncbi:MAG: hypothetical protein LQ337_002037 [Flavoplaca oasis]|nr:MAG: hypothetical protein LQ337_002037 [Flavoplaca oasis]
MSRPGRVTRSASSRANSEGPQDFHIETRSQKGSKKGGRSKAAPQDNSSYGGNIANFAGAKTRTTTAIAPGRGIGDAIGAAATQRHVAIERSNGQLQAQHLATVQERTHTPPLPPSTERIRFEADEDPDLGEDRMRRDNVDDSDDHQPYEQFGQSNGEQPLRGATALHRQFTLSNSDSSIDRPVSFFFNQLHYAGFAIFMLLLSLLFADVYRGPLLGSRFDLLKSRYPVGNLSTIVPSEFVALEQRMTAMEHGFRNQIDSLRYELHSQPRNPLAGQTKAKINYFSQIHGVAVNYHLTSPTNRVWVWCDAAEKSEPPKAPTWWQRYDPFKRLCSVSITQQYPATVFGPWEDSEGPSWCAAAGDAVLQLAATVQGPMTPTELVVEYNPNSKQIDSRTVPAPKEIELWMSVSDDVLRESIGQQFEALYGPTNSLIKALPHEYVPIGRWMYDLHSSNYMQAFEIPIHLKQATTGNVVVRVNSNWAQSPFTCLYRLRLHGLSRTTV